MVKLKGKLTNNYYWKRLGLMVKLEYSSRFKIGKLEFLDEMYQRQYC